jgi:hypothetical protein
LVTVIERLLGTLGIEGGGGTRFGGGWFGCGKPVDAVGAVVAAALGI